MNIQGTDLLDSGTETTTPPIKAVFNSHGIILFPAAQQHRDQKAAGISYEDDHAGNALAAIIQNGNIEIRYHSKFSVEQIRAILKSLREQPELAPLRLLRATYQGKALEG
jgi:hypothetical protein